MERGSGQRYRRTQENALQQWDTHMLERRRQQGFLSGEVQWIRAIKPKVHKRVPSGTLLLETLTIYQDGHSGHSHVTITICLQVSKIPFLDVWPVVGLFPPTSYKIDMIGYRPGDSVTSLWQFLHKK